MAGRWLSFPRVEGHSSRQAHVGIPEGCYEREIGREGFFGPATHMIHRHPPTAWSNWEGPLRPRAFDLNKVDQEQSCPWSGRVVMSNEDVELRWWSLSTSMVDLARNGDGDTLLFVHEGAGDLFCDYGHLAFRDGDYLLIPRGCMWRIETTEACRFMLIEAKGGSYQLPEHGSAGQHAVYDPAMLDHPRINEQFKAQQNEANWKVVIKRRNRLSTVGFAFNPLDAIGWHGNLSVVRINWRDIRPLMSHRYHVPPSAHTTFVAPGFVVCTFAPRPMESSEDALKLPFFHSNDDYDEVIFYHRGNFFSRDNIHPGMLTMHPSGFAHGPHPGAFRAAENNSGKLTDEVAVMIDTRKELTVNDDIATSEWQGYVDSWKGDYR